MNQRSWAVTIDPLLEDPCEFEVSPGRRQMQRSRPIPGLYRGDSAVLEKDQCEFEVSPE